MEVREEQRGIVAGMPPLRLRRSEVLDMVLSPDSLNALPIEWPRLREMARITHWLPKFLKVGFQGRGCQRNEKPAWLLPDILVGVGNPVWDMDHVARGCPDNLEFSVANGGKLELSFQNVEQLLGLVPMQRRSTSWWSRNLRRHVGSAGLRAARLKGQ